MVASACASLIALYMLPSGAPPRPSRVTCSGERPSATTAPGSGTPPLRSVGKGERGERFGPHLDRVTRGVGHEVAAGVHLHWIEKVLVQMRRVLRAASRRGCADGDVVDESDMLDVLAQAEAAGVRAHRHTEVRGEQQHGEHLVQTAEPAGI